GLLAEQVVREPAVAGEHGDRRTELLRALEIGQRPLGVTVGDSDGAHSRLGKRASGIGLVGAREEAAGRLGIAKLKRGLAGADQRLKILGVGGKGADVARQRSRRALVIRRVAALRLSGRRSERTGAGDKRARQAKLYRSPHHSLPRAAQNLAQKFLARGFTVSCAHEAAGGALRIEKGRP